MRSKEMNRICVSGSGDGSSGCPIIINNAGEPNLVGTLFNGSTRNYEESQNGETFIRVIPSEQFVNPLPSNN